MRHRLAIFLLCSCSESATSPYGPSCEVGECVLPNALNFAAEILPPADSNLAATEFAEIALGADRVLALDFVPSIDISLDVHDASNMGLTITSEVLLVRPSAVPGRSSVLEHSRVAASEPPPTVHVLPDTPYTVFVTPTAPDDETYVRLVRRDEVLSAGALDLPLMAPTDAVVTGSLPVLLPDMNITLEAVRDDGERSTVARIQPGDDFSLRAVEVSGVWSVQAGVTFVDPQDPIGASLPGLRIDLEGSVTCEGDPVTCDDLPSGIALLPLSQPRARTVVVGGVDAGGVPMSVANTQLTFTGDLPFEPMDGVSRATLSSSAVTDDEGRATVYLIDGIEYKVVVAPPGASEFASLVESRTVADDPIEFTLGLRPRLAGSVVAARPMEQGGGVEGVILSAVPSAVLVQTGTSPVSTGNFTTSTDGRGDFALRVDTGTYDLEMTPPEGSLYPRWSADNLTVGEDQIGQRLVLPEGVSIPVRVRAGGLGIDGATVRILVLGAAEGSVPRERSVAVTDENGDTVVLLPNPYPEP